MPSPVNAMQLARDARAIGLASTEGGSDGLADLGILQVRGRDAATFLHSQFTNDVSGLNPGEGNLSARVTRTGHLCSVMSLHALPDQDEPTFLLILERSEVQTLLTALDLFHFSEKLTLTDVSETWSWLSLHGPSTTDIALQVFGEIEGMNWDEFPEYGIRSLASTPWGDRRGEHGWIIRRDLTGDVGILVAISTEPEIRESLVQALVQAASTAEVPLLDADAYDQVLEVLRIEAGQIRPTVDMPGKARLLPETGLEQAAVSYTKGCYLGQEVIARVRTYGSVPHALRGLVLQVPEGAQADEVLARL
ncbi:MAG: hypothetical protein QGG40_13520, partial [Myxococcota bacterium]|nr:hypothetical protein [Myxococcota bacterium]